MDWIFYTQTFTLLFNETHKIYQKDPDIDKANFIYNVFLDSTSYYQLNFSNSHESAIHDVQKALFLNKATDQIFHFLKSYSEFLKKIKDSIKIKLEDEPPIKDKKSLLFLIFENCKKILTTSSKLDTYLTSKEEFEMKFLSLDSKYPVKIVKILDGSQNMLNFFLNFEQKEIKNLLIDTNEEFSTKLLNLFENCLQIILSIGIEEKKEGSELHQKNFLFINDYPEFKLEKSIETINKETNETNTISPIKFLFKNSKKSNKKNQIRNSFEGHFSIQKNEGENKLKYKENTNPKSEFYEKYINKVVEDEIRKPTNLIFNLKNKSQFSEAISIIQTICKIKQETSYKKSFLECSIEDSEDESKTLDQFMKIHKKTLSQLFIEVEDKLSTDSTNSTILYETSKHNRYSKDKLKQAKIAAKIFSLEAKQFDIVFSNNDFN